MTSQQATGRSLPRIDGPEKVTGAITYTADVPIPNALWGRLLRSSRPHARIISVDVSAAKALPGVHAVITGADVGDRMTGRRIFDIPLLATETVRFVGDPIAAVAAVDEETAERAINLIRVEYTDLPTVYDPLEAIKPGAPLLHPGFNEYEGVKPQDVPSNTYVMPTWGVGDVEEGFKLADEIIEGTYSTALMHQAYMESHTCLVSIADDGRIDVWTSNKAPHYIKPQIAQTTGVDVDRVHIHHVAIGGDFGGKGAPMNVPICYFLAEASGRPVRMVMDYAEEFSAANPRHPSAVTVRTGVKRDGTIVANDIVAYFNTGAYAGFVPLGFLPGPRHAAGPYKIPHSQVTAHHVYTNRVPAGHMRGPGEPQTIFAMESHLDVVARKLGLDPVHVRLKNVIRDGDVNGLGEEYQDLHGAEAIERARTASGYRTPGGEPTAPRVKRGWGMGIGERAPGGGETHVGVTFTTDGSVVVHTSIFEQGSGTYTILRQMVSDVLQIPPERVSVEVWDTDETGFDSGAGASRNTRMASEASYYAALEAKAALFRLAAELLGWPEEAMKLSNDTVSRTDAEGSIELVELLGRMDITVGGTYDYKDMAHSHVTAFTVQVAEVEVDTETGNVTLTKLTSLHDAGHILNPMGHDGQINGGAIQGMGYGLMEELPVHDGRVAALSFADYKIPSIADVPQMQTLTTESEGGVGPFNVKGIGENPSSPMAPAIANAVADAIGVRITDLPITAEKVYRALRGLKSGLSS
jgi:CO/xanthine dehydrogenase Mo-binding subunit